MKKISLVLSLAAALLFISCSESSAKDVYEKIKKEERLEKSDYKIMADYLLKVNSLSDNEISKLSKEEVEMVERFNFAILMAPEGSIDKETEKKLNNLSKFNEDDLKNEPVDEEVVVVAADEFCPVDTMEVVWDSVAVAEEPQL